MKGPDTVLEAIYNLLATGHPAYRAAGILLLEKYAAHLTANGCGKQASAIVKRLREDDPFKYLTPDGSDRIVV